MLIFDDNLALFIGTFAGLFQIGGYYLYIRNEGIDPNPVTWFMFSYGTALLTALEWDKGAEYSVLILPIACSLLSIIVSARCWIKARQVTPNIWWPHDWWPENNWEKSAFIADALVTIGYVGTWYLASYEIVAIDAKQTAILAFLVLSNISSFFAFYPLLHTTHSNPDRENHYPWLVWTIAYILLSVATWLTSGTFFTILMLYPLSNILLHGVMTVLAKRTVAVY